MEIESHGHKLVFRGEMERLISDMQASFDEGFIGQRLEEFQSKLDMLAAKYQHDESLGKISYKLYEAQAYLHFFSGDYNKSLEFIDEAVRVRGDDFEDAQALRSEINKQVATSNVTNNAQPAPINGWLSFFVFGIFVGVLYNLYLFSTGWSNLKQITPDVSAAYPTLRPLIIVEQIVPIICAIVGAYILYLVYKRSHLFKPFGIAFLVGSFLWFVVDMTLAQHMFANNAAALKSVNNVSPTESRNIVFTIIWTAYLIFSKDVKRVFTQ